MRRLSTRLILSHAAVALAATLATLVIVRWLAPPLFDASLRRTGRGRGGEAGLRDQVAGAVNQALVAGAAVGVVVAAALGALVAWRLTRSLRGVRAGTRRIASGDYGVRLAVPLESELAEVAADVNALAAALGATETRRVRLLGEVAHEMRTPLTVIDGYVEGVMDGVLPASPESLGQLLVETRRLRRLSDDLSALSRAEEARTAFSPMRLDLRSAVSESAERLRAQTDDAGLMLVVEVGEQALSVLADADQLAQLVTNLIGNAIRATPPGGTITVQCAQGVDAARMSVTDTGEGLAADQLEAVFERFYRVPGRRSVGSDSGSGIGLTIARSIAERHGGQLDAASEGRGHGATFTLVLPLLRD